MITVKDVAPHAGAWIETLVKLLYLRPSSSHPMRVRGLKHALLFSLFKGTVSHPMRVRGLKQGQIIV